MRSLEDTIKYWKDKRKDYIEKVTNEYKVKEARGMTEDKTFKCPLCNTSHGIDKYNFVDSCIGYFDRETIEYEIIRYLEKVKKDRKKKV